MTKTISTDLIDCPGCGTLLSPRCPECPSCSEPIAKKKKPAKLKKTNGQSTRAQQPRGYAASNLLKGERVVYEAQLHWILFVPTVTFIVALFVIFEAPLAIPIATIACLFLIARIIQYYTSEFTVTNKRVVVKTGLISRNTFELSLKKVEAVNVDQGIVGRMLNFGTVSVSGTGGHAKPFANIEDPLTLKKYAQAHSMGE